MNTSEDDTFNKLKRIPYNEMVGIMLKHTFSMIPFATNTEAEILKKHGWTQEDFQNEFAKKYPSFSTLISGITSNYVDDIDD